MHPDGDCVPKVICGERERERERERGETHKGRKSMKAALCLSFLCLCVPLKGLLCSVISINSNLKGSP